MLPVYGWFGTLRKIWGSDLCWLLWWGLFIAGFSSTWWYSAGRVPFYVWFTCLCILGAIYANAWHRKSVAIFIGMNSLIMTASLYILYFRYVVLMPDASFAGLIFSVGSGLPIVILISYAARLGRVFRYHDSH